MLLFYQSLPTKAATDTSTGTATESGNEHNAILLEPTTCGENDEEDDFRIPGGYMRLELTDMARRLRSV